MALPIDFPEANLQLNPAPGTEASVSPLKAHYEDNTITSCWKLSPDELAAVLETGVIWLHVFGTTSYPVAVNGHNPFTQSLNPSVLKVTAYEG